MEPWRSEVRVLRVGCTGGLMGGAYYVPMTAFETSLSLVW
jgi:hypothetical protein